MDIDMPWENSRAVMYRLLVANELLFLVKI